MRIEFPPEGEPIDPSWWAPLEAVARTIAGESRYRFFDPDDFMLMGKVVRRSKPDVFLYKHVHLRRHLNLDAAGHAYLYIAPLTFRPGHEGRYVLHDDLRTALDHLDLWELPSFKDGLDESPHGVASE